MPWLRHFALFVVFVAALLKPAAAGAFVSAPDAGSQARVGAFELVAATLVRPASAATCGLHEGIGPAYDENASGYRFAAGGGLGRLRSIGPSTWESSGGLVYGPDKVFGNRVQHVLAHTVPDATKPMHSVFNVGRNQVLGLVDEAWSMRGAAVAGDPGAFVVPMGRAVGTAGETAVRIVVRPGTSQIITAYPVVP